MRPFGLPEPEEPHVAVAGWILLAIVVTGGVFGFSAGRPPRREQVRSRLARPLWAQRCLAALSATPALEMLNNDVIALMAGAVTAWRAHGLSWMVYNVATLIPTVQRA